ncbi:MAG TPA: hypothetical protein VJ252_06965, partial [Chthoniobacterales bacterium]|nr:hypothetical protein [Chthoniobacterales bacterium]
INSASKPFIDNSIRERSISDFQLSSLRMSRPLLLVIIGAVAAFAIWYAFRISEKSRSATAAAFLPRETIVFVHVPDFNQTRGQWHQSDIYQLCSEPSVQEFLRKPLATLPKRNATAATLREIEQLDAKDAFAAVTKIDNNNPKLVGGFRFRGSPTDAENIIERWRSKLLTNNPAAKREKSQHERHQIDTITVAPFVLATVFDGEWFFASNDLAELKNVLDRADHRMKESTLDADKDFRGAMAHMPLAYAASFYLQPKLFADKIASLRAEVGRNVPADQRTIVEQMRSICVATRFERGKIHDVSFVGMPKLEDAKLTRSSLTLGTKDTFLYLAMLLNLGQKFDAINQATGSAAVGAGWQKALQAFARSGVSADDWKAAFGVELGVVADWPESTRWPWLFIAFPVKDAAKAGKIIESLTVSNPDGANWTQTEKDGVRYFSMVSAASLIAISPMIALSNRIVIGGLDPVSVEAAVQRNVAGTSELENSASYENAARSVPAPTNFFTYINLPLLYTRLDSTLRPMLFMTAFVPQVAKYVDVNKLPPAEVVTKHLSPIVSSQRYDGDGYVAESVGSITLNQSGAGLIALGALGTLVYQREATAPQMNGLVPIPPSKSTPTTSPGSGTGKGYKPRNSPLPTPAGLP